MIRTAGLSAAVVMALVLPASAQSTFERMETAVVAMNGMMFDELVVQTPALDGHMPTPEWSDALRTAT